MAHKAYARSRPSPTQSTALKRKPRLSAGPAFIALRPLAVLLAALPALTTLARAVLLATLLLLAGLLPATLLLTTLLLLTRLLATLLLAGTVIGVLILAHSVSFQRWMLPRPNIIKNATVPRIVP